MTVILNSNLIDINGENRRVKFATFSSYTGNKIDISSARYIFAMGGIENSRYLLWFQKKYSNKFFDSNLPVGEYWMEHPYFSIGKAIVDKRKIVKNFYSLSPQAQKELYILNCSFRFDYLHEQGTKALIRDALCVAPNLGKKLLKLANRNLVCGAILRASWEQAPIAENRISLDTQLDKFKIPRSIL